MRYHRAAHSLFLDIQGGGAFPPNIFQKKFFFFYLWAHLHNLIKLSNNFSVLKKIENPLLHPLKNRIIRTSMLCNKTGK